MKNEAFVYGWKNVENGKMYVGYHKSKEINDGYVFSSENLELREAWSYGKMRRAILHKGSASECITMERAILKKFDARRTDQWYNGTNGGGEGLGDWEAISDEDMAVAIDWVNGIEPEEEVTDIYNVGNTELVRDIHDAISEREGYEVVSVPVEEILQYEQNQVRATMYNHDKTRAIAEQMKENPAQARELVSPIIVCVSDDNTNTIIDGNHTSRAVSMAGWTHADVVFLNFSEFENNQFNVDMFGSWANHDPIIKEGNLPIDCQRQIINMYAAKFEGSDEDFKILESDKFKETCLAYLCPLWTKRQVVNNLKNAITKIKTKDAEARLNFQTYTRQELDGIEKEYAAENPDRSTIVVSSSSCYNSGIGGILNKMQAEGGRKGTIIIHHGNIKDYEARENSINRLKGTMQFLRDDVDVQFDVLSSFEK